LPELHSKGQASFDENNFDVNEKYDINLGNKIIRSLVTDGTIGSFAKKSCSPDLVCVKNNDDDDTLVGISVKNYSKIGSENHLNPPVLQEEIDKLIKLKEGTQPFGSLLLLFIAPYLGNLSYCSGNVLNSGYYRIKMKKFSTVKKVDYDKDFEEYEKRKIDKPKAKRPAGYFFIPENMQVLVLNNDQFKDMCGDSYKEILCLAENL